MWEILKFFEYHYYIINCENQRQEKTLWYLLTLKLNTEQLLPSNVECIWDDALPTCVYIKIGISQESDFDARVWIETRSKVDPRETYQEVEENRLENIKYEITEKYEKLHN